MLGAYKKQPQAYLLYVEDCFLLSDNADTRIFSKGVYLAKTTNKQYHYILMGLSKN